MQDSAYTYTCIPCVYNSSIIWEKKIMRDEILLAIFIPQPIVVNKFYEYLIGWSNVTSNSTISFDFEVIWIISSYLHYLLSSNSSSICTYYYWYHNWYFRSKVAELMEQISNLHTSCAGLRSILYCSAWPAYFLISLHLF